MPEDVADAVLDEVKHFTIGFVGARDTPAAKGSGFLIKHGELHGILTCAHVDTYLRELKQPVGLVRLNRGLAQQSGTLNMDEVMSYAAGEKPWTKGDDDISFIHLPPHLVGNIKKDCVFLDAEKNFSARARRLLIADPGALHLRARRTVHWRNDAAKRPGDDLTKGRADVRSLARVGGFDCYVRVLRAKYSRSP